MSRVRAAIRLTAIAAATTALYAVYMAGPRRRASWRNRMVRAWARTLSRILGMRASVAGPRPTGAFLLVTNHVSYLDILLLAQITDVVFVAKSEVRRWPFIGTLAASVGTIFVNRSSRRDTVRVAAEMETAVRKGMSIALFPEGTSSDGSTVLPFKSSLLDVAVRTGLPVHHGAIRYGTDVSWWGDMEFAPHFRQVLQLPEITATLRFGHAVTAGDRKELAQRLWRGVREELAKGDPEALRRS